MCNSFPNKKKYTSKQNVINAILYFADYVGKGDGYNVMISTTTLPEVVKTIVYDMFLKRFNSYYCSDGEYVMYNVLMDYAKELNEKGYVTFE